LELPLRFCPCCNRHEKEGGEERVSHEREEKEIGKKLGEWGSKERRGRPGEED